MMINAFPPKIQWKSENGKSKKEKKRKEEKKKKERGKERGKKGKQGGLNVHQTMRPKRPPHLAAWMTRGLNVHTPNFFFPSPIGGQFTPSFNHVNPAVPPTMMLGQ